MAVDSSRLGKSIVDDLKAGGYFSPDATPDKTARSIAEWTVIANSILKELKTNMEIDLSSGDIKVLPGAFAADGKPVTGIGLIQGTNLLGKLT